MMPLVLLLTFSLLKHVLSTVVTYHTRAPTQLVLEKDRETRERERERERETHTHARTQPAVSSSRLIFYY